MISTMGTTVSIKILNGGGRDPNEQNQTRCDVPTSKINYANRGWAIRDGIVAGLPSHFISNVPISLTSSIPLLWLGTV